MTVTKALSILGAVLLALMVLALPAAAADAPYNIPTANEIYPTYTGGNDASCSPDPAADNVVSFRIEDEDGIWVLDLDDKPPADGSYEIYAGGEQVGTLYYGGQYRSDDGRWMIDWSVTGGTFTGEIRVKGGPGYLTYVYEDGIAGDQGLYSPKNEAGQWAEISHVTFCGYFTPDEQEECWDDETAWAEGSRYVSKGNWAMYVPYDDTGMTVDILAGQTLKAGTATFSAPVDGEVTITINLNDGFRFAAVDENIKVQDYDQAPSGNPSPGLFAYKNTVGVDIKSYTITVPENNFYGVHLDVQHRVSCPIET